MSLHDFSAAATFLVRSFVSDNVSAPHRKDDNHRSDNVSAPHRKDDNHRKNKE